MLVLTRKINERILIGDNIVLEVVAIRGNRVRLGITTNTGVRIVREELLSLDERSELSSRLLL
ncbi:Carbon storage regulator [Gimesia alba]|uniref:Translational regulator CsrA n=1 Tax=Gimesia alba TaxID=2527973 RepID=A0A517RAX4_9PLAN|nr:carbon storage regulator [Gimesia alba]QDT41029.1 Carbon storage regulator [Gimesia alba]